MREKKEARSMNFPSLPHRRHGKEVNVEHRGVTQTWKTRKGITIRKGKENNRKGTAPPIVTTYVRKGSQKHWTRAGKIKQRIEKEKGKEKGRV